MITSVNSTTDTTSSSESLKQSTGLSKDDFLKLFIAQIQNQDPLNPSDSSEYVSQLAQLTQVEQSYNTTSALEKLLAAQNNSTALSAVSFVGKSATANGDAVAFDGSSSATLQFNLSDAVTSATVTITDSFGNTVRSATLGSLASGDGSYSWDGRDNSGDTVDAGTYTFSVTGSTAGSSEVSATGRVSGEVSGVSFAGDTPTLTIGGVDVPLTDVISVSRT